MSEGHFAAPPPPPTTRSLSVVLREALTKGEEVRLIVAKALADDGTFNTAAYMKVEIEGQTVVVPKVVGSGLGGSGSGYPVYVFATDDFMIAVGTVATGTTGPGSTGGVIPIGGIIEWATATPPVGWLACDGSAFSAATYPLLAAVLGGTTLPDLVRRVPVGAGAGYAVGTGDGQPQANRSPSHHHGVSGGVTVSVSGGGAHQHGEAGGHRHAVEGDVGSFAYGVGNTGQRGTAAQTFNLVSGFTPYTNESGTHTHPGVGDHGHGASGSVNLNTSGGTPTDSPSFIVLNFIIRAQ